jgi:hypothetical protein
MRERPLSAVPHSVLLLLALTLGAQIALRAVEPHPSALARDLPPPPTAVMLRVAAFGEPIALAQMLTLYLQAFDTQPGVSIPFRDLDYSRVEAWLATLVGLDPEGQYPLMMAAQVYSQVPDPARQRRMLEFTYREFLADPVRRWRWLAHAAIMAKHRLDDLPLALQYAESLARHADDPTVPSWARQMHIFVLEDMGEYETARVLLGGLLASGAITDASEARFLTERLNALDAAEKSTPSSR